MTVPALELSPVIEPLFTQLLVTSMRDERIETGPKEQAFDTAFRHSDGGKCTRYLGLKLAGVPFSSEFDLAADWVTSVGTTLHEMWQESLLARYPDAQIELKVRNGDLTSGHIDAFIVINGVRFSYELKSINGYGFSKAVGVMKQHGGALVPPEGPKVPHIIQASLNAFASDADYAVLGYLALESISMQVAANLGLGELDRIMAEWVISRDQYEPVARSELARLADVRDAVEAGVIPMAQAVADDWSAIWLNPNNNFRDWRCWYCPYLDKCKTLAPLDIPLDEV
jgi:hypothetical protein